MKNQRKYLIKYQDKVTSVLIFHPWVPLKTAPSHPQPCKKNKQGVLFLFLAPLGPFATHILTLLGYSKLYFT